MGFSDITFRLMELGAQLIAPLALLMGLAELLGTTPIARFLARLYLPALGLIALGDPGHGPADRVGLHQGLAGLRPTTSSSRTSCWSGASAR